MKTLSGLVISWLLVLCSTQSSAVQLNPRGLGEVLIYPYYTVNNDLNFLYTVVNTTEQPKAIKISFHEGDAGLVVLDFHVYLSPFDVWSGALGPATSSIGDHVGEPSLWHATADQSCAPYLLKAGQEFLPFVIDTDADPENRSMSRATAGYLQVIEMGVLTGSAAAAVDHTTVGIPQSCGALEGDWGDDEWSLGELDEPQGGLTGSAGIINVAEGLSVSYDAIALNQFWQGPGVFTAPGDPLPDLGSGSNESRVLLSDGSLVSAEWSTGIEAVSAVLMKSQIHNEYSYDAIVNGKSEWVMSFPTKGLHTRVDAPIQPFANSWDGRQSCDEFSAMLVDRSQQPHQLNPEVGPLSQLCQVTNVLEFLPGDGGSNAKSAILGSDNTVLFAGSEDQRVTENGWALLSFSGETQAMVPVSGVGMQGLPVTGFMVQQFTNAGAAQGLLAQYANLFNHTGRVSALDHQ